MNKYETIKDKSNEDFKRLTGVKKMQGKKY